MDKGDMEMVIRAVAEFLDDVLMDINNFGNGWEIERAIKKAIERRYPTESPKDE